MENFWSNRKTILWWVATFGWMAVIFYFSSRPQSAIPHFLPDYIFHFIEYAVLSVLVLEALVNQNKGWSLSRISTLTMIITAFYATTDEFHQAFVPTRTASLSDWLADFLGTLLIVGMGVVILKHTSRYESTG